MADLAGRVFLVTGSTDGIGAHTAAHLVAQGATVLVHGRSPARVEQAVARCAAAGGGGARVRGYTADLSSLEEVRGLAAALRQDFPTIDVVINNAGVFEPTLRKSQDGLEMTWAVNVAAPFLLTALLLGGLSGTGRILNVSSISAAASLDFGNLQQERGYSAHGAYSLSKLAEQLFTFELAARLAAAGSPLTCNTLDPGTVNTKMLFAGWGPIGIDVKDANYEFKLATDPALAGVSGCYYVGGRQSRSPGPAYDAAARQRLWRVLEEQTGARWSM